MSLKKKNFPFIPFSYLKKNKESSELKTNKFTKKKVLKKQKRKKKT